ncbi:MAG: RodZ domain-containing protein [Elusimicrobiota bacterium]
MSPSRDSQPKDAGTVLRKRRMLRGQSLESVHQTTRIPKKFLEALERNDPKEFPAPVYMRGFLKSYCDFLELEFDPLWDLVSPKSSPAASEGEASSGNGKPAKDSKRPPVILPFNESTILPFMLFSALALAGTILWTVSARDSGQVPPPPKTFPPAILKPIHRLGNPKLTIASAAGGFIRLKVDGVLRFEGRLPPGSRQEWEARAEFSLRASEPGAIRLTLDGAAVALEDFTQSSDGWFNIRRR